MTQSQFLFYIAPFVSFIIIILYIWSRWFQPECPNAYAEWLRGIKKDNPNYKPPYIMGPNGKYIENPKFTENQVIIYKL